MATRTIRVLGDEVLNKVCKEVKGVTPKTRELIDDMFETMYDAMGVGLAANQVGMLKRIVVIIETSGEQRGYEGCLSVPGKTGIVTRPDYAKVKAYDEDMNEFILEGEGLLARAICHECEHLDGHMYVEKVEGELEDVAPYDEEE